MKKSIKTQIAELYMSRLGHTRGMAMQMAQNSINRGVNTMEEFEVYYANLMGELEQLSIRSTFEAHKPVKETEKAVLLHIDGESRPAKWFPKSHCDKQGDLYFPAAWLLK
ncbi:MAG: hypothetical protein ACK5JU_03615 [Bacteroidales bacterium]